MKSTPCARPKLTMSSSSFSVMVGRSTMAPGRFMFLRSPIVASLSTRTTTWLARAGAWGKGGRVGPAGASARVGSVAPLVDLLHVHGHVAVGREHFLRPAMSARAGARRPARALTEPILTVLGNAGYEHVMRVSSPSSCDGATSGLGAREAGRRAGRLTRATHGVVGVDDQGLPAAQRDGAPALESASADLGTLGVQQHGDLRAPAARSATATGSTRNATRGSHRRLRALRERGAQVGERVGVHLDSRGARGHAGRDAARVRRRAPHGCRGRS